MGSGLPGSLPSYIQGGPKTGPLNVDNFAMVSVERRVICQKFENFI